MTTSVPFLTRFALPIVEPIQDEAVQVVSSQSQTGQIQGHRGESRFTRVTNETTDDE
jgi:hypothetical protein